MSEKNVDFNLTSNQIHYYSFLNGSQSKVKKSYESKHKAEIALKQQSYLQHVKLKQFYVICECPICDKYHIIPKKKINKEIVQYIVNKKDET